MKPQRNTHVLRLATTRNSSGDEIANVDLFYDDIVHVLQNTKSSFDLSGSLQKCHRGKIRLTVEFENNDCNIQQLVCDHLRITHSFSVTYANIATSDIVLKTRFWLHFCRTTYQCIFNHFYAMNPESHQIR